MAAERVVTHLSAIGRASRKKGESFALCKADSMRLSTSVDDVNCRDCLTLSKVTDSTKSLKAAMKAIREEKAKIEEGSMPGRLDLIEQRLDDLERKVAWIEELLTRPNRSDV